MANRFQNRLLKARNRIEKRGITMAFAAIKRQYKAVYDVVGIYSIDQLKESISNVVTKTPIVEFMLNFYPLSGEIAMMYRNDLISQKSDDDRWENLFMEQLRSFGLVETGANITSITSTSEQFIRGAVESAISEAVEGGLGVEQTSRLIRKHLTDSLGDIGRSRAKMIAQTELINGSNQAAMYGADSTGFEYMKFWSTSGLKNIRDSHIFAEENHPKGIRKGDRFDMGDGTFMMRPGDAAGGAGNVINCRCSLIIDII